MSFSIDTFTSKFSQGGALASLFRARLEVAKGSGSSVEDFEFLHPGNDVIEKFDKYS